MKGIKCSCCISLVYKKCSKLKTSEITELQKSKRKHWQCISCQSHKFPYATIDAIELQKNPSIQILHAVGRKKQTFQLISRAVEKGGKGCMGGAKPPPFSGARIFLPHKIKKHKLFACETFET